MEDNNINLQSEKWSDFQHENIDKNIAKPTITSLVVQFIKLLIWHQL